MKAEKEEFRSYLEKTVYSASNLEKYMDRSLEYLLELPSAWASSDYSGKRKLQNIIFPEGFYYNKKNDQPRATKMNSVFSCIARLKGNAEQKETGISEMILKNSGLVARTRIELVSRV